VYAILTVADLKMTDSGKYICTVRQKGSDSNGKTMSNSTSVDINVSATRGQIVVKSTSDSDQTIDAGRGLNLFVSFQAWPDNYEKKWYKVRINIISMPRAKY
jgi:hypothetical protein